MTAFWMKIIRLQLRPYNCCPFHNVSHHTQPLVLFMNTEWIDYSESSVKCCVEMKLFHMPYLSIFIFGEVYHEEMRKVPPSWERKSPDLHRRCQRTHHHRHHVNLRNLNNHEMKCPKFMSRSCITFPTFLPARGTAARSCYLY